jgi:hypothetical protein
MQMMAFEREPARSFKRDTPLQDKDQNSVPEALRGKSNSNCEPEKKSVKVRRSVGLSSGGFHAEVGAFQPPVRSHFSGDFQFRPCSFRHGHGI